MRSHETLRQVIEAIDAADGTGLIEVHGVDNATVQSYLDVLAMAEMAEALDDPPYARLTGAGLELLIYSRDPDLWGPVAENFDDVTVVSAMLLTLRRAQREKRSEDDRGGRGCAA